MKNTNLRRYNNENIELHKYNNEKQFYVDLKMKNKHIKI
jgi:hypothetical protein